MATPEQMQNLKSMLAGSSVPKNTSSTPSQTTDWSSYTPPAPKISVAPTYTPPSSMTEAESRLPVTPEAPAPQAEGNDWSMKKLFQPTMTAGKAVGNFFTSSEQKLGKIGGDSMAGVEDQAAVNDANERAMQAKLIHQIALNKQEGKDTSHLEWALSKSMQNFKGAQQQIAEQAPGSLATNEEFTGAAAGTMLDALSAGTYGKYAQGMEGGKLAAKGTSLVAQGAEKLGIGVTDVSKLPSLVEGVLPASRTATEILKETGKTALKGAGVGAAYGATGAMQNDESAGGVVGQAALGGVLGFAVPALLGTASAVKQLVSPNTDVAIKKYTDFTKELGQNYKDISKSTEKAAKFGKDPRELLVQKAEQGSYIPVKMKLNGTYDTTSEAIPKMWQDTNDLLALKRAVNNTNSQRVSLNEARNAVLERIKETSDIGDYKKVSKIVNAEFNSLASDPRLQANALTMNDLGDIVTKQWKESNSLFTKTNRPDFASNAHYQIGQAVNDVIDKYSDDVRVKDLNQLIGHHLETIKFLENLNGKAPTGKYFGKQFARVIGAMAGSHAGPGGMIAGSEMGKRAADLAHAYSGHDPFVGSVLEDIAKSNPQIVLQAQDYLEKNAGKLSTEGLNKGANMVTKLPLKSTKGVLDLSGGKAEIPSGVKTKLGVSDVYQEAKAAEKARREVYRNGGAKLPSSEEVIPLRGESLPNAVSVTGKKAPKNWEQAIYRSRYEAEKGLKPTVSVPETQNVIDAVTGKDTGIAKTLSENIDNSLSNKMVGARDNSINYFRANPSEITKDPIRIREVDGKLVIEDGRHRLQVAKELGITPNIQDVTPEYTGKESSLLKKILGKKK